MDKPGEWTPTRDNKGKKPELWDQMTPGSLPEVTPDLLCSLGELAEPLRASVASWFMKWSLRSAHMGLLQGPHEMHGNSKALGVRR